MGAEKTFFEAQRTAIAAVEITSGVKAFPRVWVAPGQTLDIERLLRVPRWPTAVILDGGFTTEKSNGKIRRGQFDVAVVSCKQRDQVGDATALEIMDLGDVLAAALEIDVDNAIFAAGAGKQDSITWGDTLLVVARRYTFEYALRMA